MFPPSYKPHKATPQRPLQGIRPSSQPGASGGAPAAGNVFIPVTRTPPRTPPTGFHSTNPVTVQQQPRTKTQPCNGISPLRKAQVPPAAPAKPFAGANSVTVQPPRPLLPMHNAISQPKHPQVSPGPAPIRTTAQPRSSQGLPRRTETMKLNSGVIGKRVYAAGASIQRAKEEMKSNYGTRSKSRGAQGTTATLGVPSGYTRLSNAFLLSKGIEGNPEIYHTEYNGKKLLWWGNPSVQIDDFVYFGDRDADIRECTRLKGCPSGYTWHHTGCPAEEDHGTMQLVPTNEHSKIPHWGGVAISLGKLQ